MTLPTLVACLIAVMFFISGCLQIAIYVGTQTTTPFISYLPGLLGSAWPLAVAAVIFVLVDIRIHQTENVGKNTHDIPSPPVPHRHPAAHTPGSYFSTRTREMPQPPNAAAGNAAAPAEQQERPGDDLNFFKM